MTAGAKLGVMSADLDALVALMPFAGHLGLVLDEASPDRVIARPEWAPHLCTSRPLPRPACSTPRSA
jgi:hypothetical protein